VTVGTVAAGTEERLAVPAPRLLATGIAKSFGATHALIRADLEVRPGEVHTVLGENGSGKSTLVKIVSGVHRPDRGSLLLDGVPAADLRTPARARARGISTVFQEVLTVHGRSILENVWLGSRSAVGAAERRRRAGDVLERLLGVGVDVDRPVESLSLSGRQACCIARSLVAQPQVLVLDESTSALDVATRDRLFAIVRELTATGTAVVFISHRMDEVFEISTVVTVLRSGATVASRLEIGRTSVADLVRLMSEASEGVREGHQRIAGRPVLRAQDVRLRRGATPIDLELRAGELVGLAGLEGHGQEAFLLALRGFPPACGGTVTRVDAAKPVVLDGPAIARRQGIGYVPRERRNEALFEQLSIRENFGLPTVREDTVAGVIRPTRTDRRLARHAGPLHLKMRHPGNPITTLSGGNQQKVVIARALADQPGVLLLNDPTRGIDASAKQDLYEVLQDLCDAGTAVVVLSTEVDELVNLVDRVLVFRDQQVVAQIPRDRLTRSTIVSAYFGPGATPDPTPPTGGAPGVDAR
jgi:ABC-type sugar transport system ATPase subunit